MKNSASLSSPESEQWSPTPASETPAPTINSKSPVSPIVTIYNPTWLDHLLAIGFIIFCVSFTALATSILYHIIY